MIVGRWQAKLPCNGKVCARSFGRSFADDDTHFHTVANVLQKVANQSYNCERGFGRSFTGEEGPEDINEDKARKKRGHSYPSQGQQNNELLPSSARMPEL